MGGVYRPSAPAAYFNGWAYFFLFFRVGAESAIWYRYRLSSVVHPYSMGEDEGVENDDRVRLWCDQPPQVSPFAVR